MRRTPERDLETPYVAPGSTSRLQGKPAIAGFLATLRGVIRLADFSLLAAHPAHDAVTPLEHQRTVQLEKQGTLRLGAAAAGRPARLVARAHQSAGGPGGIRRALKDGTRTGSKTFCRHDRPAEQDRGPLPGRELVAGAATEGLAIRQFRRPDGQIEPEVGGDGLVYVFASLSEGQLVEKGFSSVPHLTHAFSREMGIAPARFRRVLRELERVW